MGKKFGKDVKEHMLQVNGHYKGKTLQITMEGFTSEWLGG
jgi:hypothetical protein